MSLTKEAMDEIRDIAERFVGAYVKCCGPPFRYSVSGCGCETLEHAATLAMEKCMRPPVAWIDAEEQEQILREQLLLAIKNLGCR